MATFHEKCGDFSKIFLTTLAKGNALARTPPRDVHFRPFTNFDQRSVHQLDAPLNFERHIYNPNKAIHYDRRIVSRDQWRSEHGRKFVIVSLS